MELKKIILSYKDIRKLMYNNVNKAINVNKMNVYLTDSNKKLFKFDYFMSNLPNV